MEIILFINSILIVLMFLFFGHKTFVKNTDIRSVIEVYQSKDKFYVTYKEDKLLKIESYNKIPLCQNYVVVNDVYTLNVLGLKDKIISKNNLSCVEDIKIK